MAIYSLKFRTVHASCVIHSTKTTQLLAYATSQLPPSGFALTECDHEVLALMVEEPNNTQIDARLLPAHPTVKSLASNIQSKLGVASCMEVVTLTLRNRIVP